MVGDAYLNESHFIEVRASIEELFRNTPKHRPLPAEWYVPLHALGARALDAVRPLLNDNEPLVRERAYMAVARLATEASAPEQRRELITHMGAGLFDPPVRRTVVRCLSLFAAEDFPEGVKTDVRLALDQVDMRSQVGHELLRLVGVAGMEDQLPRLQEIVNRYGPLDTSNGTWYASPAFTALRVRARLGVRADVTKCIELLESHPDSDERVGLLGSLSYIRQPEVVDYLWQYVRSDRVTTGGGGDLLDVSDSAHAIVALRAMLDSEQTPNTSDREVWLAWMEAHKDKWPLKR